MKSLSNVGWLFVMLLYCTVTNASHFRGGTVSWKHLGQSGGFHNIEINYRLGWRRTSYFPNCDDNAIQSQSPGYGDGSWIVNNASTYFALNQTTEIICTAYEIDEIWAYGFNSFVANVSASGPFNIGYYGYAWISGAVNAGGYWRLTAGNIDLDTRSDTALVNRPPSTFSSPIVKLTQGCPEDIVIRYQDDDDDRVTCRYARSGASPDECGDACNGASSIGYPHFSLNETTCTIRYDGGGAATLVGVTLVLEDHPRSSILLNGRRVKNPSDFLSQIPLQFIVKVDSSAACNVVPTYPSQTIQENAKIMVPLNGRMNTTLYAYSSSALTWVTQFVVFGPLGMQVGPVGIMGNSLYSSYLYWVPASNQKGTHSVCYYAVDSGGLNGRQICFTVIVDDDDPCSIDNGGCSDVCVSTSESRFCLCSLPCWSLALDGVTCAPQTTVECDGESMRVSVADCASNKTVVAGNPLLDTTKSECQSLHIGNRHVLNWNSSTCGLAYEVNPVQVQYAGNMWVWHGVETGSSVITRGEYRVVPVTCVLPTTSQVSASFVPVIPFNDESFPTDHTIDGLGEFSLYFEFYRSSAYSSVISPSEYPMSVRVNDRFHFAIGAYGGRGFKIFTEECEAVTSAPDPDQQPLTYQFLRNGCFLDSTLTQLPSGNDMEERFSMQAFDFAEKLTSLRDNADISLQCKLIICDATNTTSRCFKGCVSSRKKRSFFERVKRETDDDDDDDFERPEIPESELIDVKGRFILIADPSIRGTNTDSSNNLYWALIAVGVLLLLVLMLYVGHRMLQSKRNGSRPTLSRNFNSQWNKAAEIDT